LFAFGAPDGVVVNVTADATWNREASMPESANNWRASSLDEIAPANVQRPLVREFPPNLAGKKLPVGMLLGAKQVSDSLQHLTDDYRALVEGTGQFTSGLVEKAIPGETVGGQVARGVGAVTDAATSALTGALHAQRGHDAVEPDAVTQPGIGERDHDAGRLRDTAGFEHDVLGLIATFDDLLDGGEQVVADVVAHAAVGQADDVAVALDTDDQVSLAARRRRPPGPS
jgi:hypothetical protein